MSWRGGRHERGAGGGGARAPASGADGWRAAADARGRRPAGIGALAVRREEFASQGARGCLALGGLLLPLWAFRRAFCLRIPPADLRSLLRLPLQEPRRPPGPGWRPSPSESFEGGRGRPGPRLLRALLALLSARAPARAPAGGGAPRPSTAGRGPELRRFQAAPPARVEDASPGEGASRGPRRGLDASLGRDCASLSRRPRHAGAPSAGAPLGRAPGGGERSLSRRDRRGGSRTSILTVPQATPRGLPPGRGRARKAPRRGARRRGAGSVEDRPGTSPSPG